jgi:methionyl-tRNA synthetase
VIISSYDPATLSSAFGIDMSTIHIGAIEEVGVGAGWGRIPPGCRTNAHQHDEIEVIVIIAGSGEIIVDGKQHPAGPGTVAQSDPFETHVLANTGSTDLIFATFYWRNPARAAASAVADSHRRRFHERPVFVFSTPPTPNGDLHLGHLSGPYLGADVFVRFQRMNGVRAWHLTGSDDFQSYVLGAARRESCGPAETAAKYSAEIAATLALMDIELDQYTATGSDPAYPEGMQGFFSRLVASGSVAPRQALALFDGENGQYLYEVDVTGGCPTCGQRTGGNVCEECGEPNVCVDLVDPRSQLSDAPIRQGSIARFSLPLHEFRKDVAVHHHQGRVPARLRELAERIFARDRLDLPITHPSAWGVPLAEPGADGQQVIWALPEMSYGFLHGIEKLGRRLGEDWRAAEPQQDWKIVHFFGYDNSFYHAVLFPVLYKLAFPGWEPDIDYHVNEFYLLDSSKFSTGRRHAIWGKDILGPDTVDAVRYFLSRTRPESCRTNFDRSAYDAAVRDTLIGTWQRWLTDLGDRVEKHYGGVVPDAGIWTPEHAAFLARLNGRLSAVAASLGQDGFSLNQAAAELNGMVEDAVRFCGLESAVTGSGDWKDETRTAIALELAAAGLLARCAAPVMPRFARRLAAALGLPEQAEWPRSVELVPEGTRIHLANQIFFGAPQPTPPLLTWLGEVVRHTLQLPADESIADKTLAELGASSLQAIALQFQILEKVGADILVDDLLGVRDVTALAAFLAELAARA